MSQYDLILSAALAGGFAALLSNITVPLVREMAFFLKAVDHPGGRKTHKGSVARLGGIAIAVGLALGVGAAALISWAGWGSSLPTKDLAALVFATFIVFLGGLVDDVVGVSALKKLLVQVAATSILVGIGWQFTKLGLPGGEEIQLGPLSGILTIVWIVGVTNAINLIDGLDGLANGVVAIIAASFLVYSFLLVNPFAVALMAGIVGACVGFFPYNKEPAQIFMGDAGSLTLGFLLGAISVHTTLKSPAAVAILVPILALGVPVMDTLLVMGVRFLERPKGKTFHRFLRMFHADRNHLHHLLEVLVISQRSTVRWIYGMVLASCLMALTVALTKRGGLALVLVLVELVAVALVRQLGFAKRAEAISRRQREGLAKELYLAEVAVDDSPLDEGGPGKEGGKPSAY